MAAATARPMSGGRGISSETQAAVENASFSTGINVNDNGILHYDDEGGLNSDGQRQSSGRDRSTGFISRSAFGFQVGSQAQEGASPNGLFASDLMHGIGVYERALMVTTGGTVRPGSVLNHLY